jgi:putative transposase
VKFAFIDSHRTQYRVTRMCSVLDVSRNGFYDWKQRKVSERAKRHIEMTDKIRVIYSRNRCLYGSPRIHRALVNQHEKVSENTVASLMRKAGIQAKTHRKFVVTTESRHGFKVADNVLNRDFRPDKANRAWVSDVTFISTRQGFVFLAAVMELYSRRIVGWAMGNRNTAELVCNALRMAIDQCHPERGLIVHSDRGIQYVSNEYQELLRSSGFVCSMSRKKDCWDNAPMESFFHTLKTELVMFEDYQTREEARSNIFEYIEVFYNRSRLHSSIGYTTPAAYERIIRVA